METTSIAWWISQLGLSGGMLFIAWRCLLFIRPLIIDIIPYIKQLLNGHIRLIQVLEERMTTGEDTLNQVANSLHQVAGTQQEHGVLIHEIHSTVVNR